MASWRGVAFLSLFAALFFLVSAILLLRAGHIPGGVLLVIMAAVNSGLCTYYFRRFRADQE